MSDTRIETGVSEAELSAIEARANLSVDASYPSVLRESEYRHDVGALAAEVRRLQDECCRLTNLALDRREDLKGQIIHLRDECEQLRVERNKAVCQRDRVLAELGMSWEKFSGEPGPEELDKVARSMMCDQMSSLLPPAHWSRDFGQTEWSALSEMQRDRWRERARKHREQYADPSPHE